MEFWLIRVIDLREWMGEDEVAESPVYSKEPYEAQLRWIDLSQISPASAENALECIGAEKFIRELETNQARMEVLADALSEFGEYGPMGVWTSAHRDRARAKARKEYWRLMEDEEYLHAQKERPVNKIGSTAREYMRGDVHSALRRADPKDPLMRIPLKMYAHATHTLGGEPIPEDIREKGRNL
jgi:hypothetical protein